MESSNISGSHITTQRKEQRAQSLQTAMQCAQIAEDYRGRETVILDLTGLTPIVDFFVITTGTSQRQMHALADEVNRLLKADGQTPLGREGLPNSNWILQDYGDIVLHLFTEEARALYDLEHLWADAVLIDWKKGDVPLDKTTGEDAG